MLGLVFRIGFPQWLHLTKLEYSHKTRRLTLQQCVWGVLCCFIPGEEAWTHHSTIPAETPNPWQPPISFHLCDVFKILFIILYLFLAVLGLRCCAQAFSSCGEWRLLFIAVRGLLTVVASLVEHGL